MYTQQTSRLAETEIVTIFQMVENLHIQALMNDRNQCLKKLDAVCTSLTNEIKLNQILHDSQNKRIRNQAEVKYN